MRLFGVNEFRKSITQVSKNISSTLLSKMLRSGTSLMAKEMQQRIFTDGKDATDKLISTRYSTTQMYVTKEMFVKKSAFKRVGKTGKKTKSTMYLERGYKQLREIQGMDVSKVNLKYTGQLKSNYNPIGAVVSVDKSAGRGGKTDTVNIKLKIGFKTKLDAYKAEKLEKQYQKKVFRPSKKEVNELIKYMRNV